MRAIGFHGSSNLSLDEVTAAEVSLNHVKILHNGIEPRPEIQYFPKVIEILVLMITLCEIHFYEI